ncbi:hypothetical protein MLD38_019928 [Melastoma candidum]|uniref:Uncharacterized protein n=1 Tax=Melastoma candidum TaxID=119954 RepID=A0ACB9QCB4_9MYRT|nr:hypothetical protein MLD38_019928 [Melastoma candidum]
MWLRNLLTYSSLTYGFCQEGNADDAEKLLGDMEKKGSLPDHVTYASLIDGYVIVGRLDHAFLLLKHMLDAGCQPNYSSYGVLLKGLQRRPMK